MKISPTLSWYIAKQFLLSFLLVMASVSAIIIVLDGLELVKKANSKDVPFYVVIQMIFLKYPLVGQKIIPFALLIGSVLSYTKLNRSNELVVIRAAGVSVWRFLMPSLISALLIGVFMVAVVNPLSCLMLLKYEVMDGKYFSGKNSFVDISQSGLWLRQKSIVLDNNEEVEGEIIIHATSIDSSFLNKNSSKIILNDVIIFVYKNDDDFFRRVDAEQASLVEGFWHLKDVIVTGKESVASHLDEYFLESDLTISDIHNSFASPETVSVWNLQQFIDTMKRSGFSALSHSMRFNSLIASPFFYCAMVLIASLFSLRHHRQGGEGVFIAASILTGFLIYFTTNIIYSLGVGGNMPVILAVWAPIVVSMLVGAVFLLHFEDG